MLPYILKTRSQFSECKIRVFTLANRKNEVDTETRNMATLLAKFRIEFSLVVVVPGNTYALNWFLNLLFKISLNKLVN